MAGKPGMEASSNASFPDQLRAATRTDHLALNRLITSRLPLCLPPHATEPTAYAKGITVFSHIFFAFENAWTVFLNSPQKEARVDNVRMQKILSSIDVTGLRRTARLQADQTSLEARLGAMAEKDLNKLEVRARYFQSSIGQAARRKPHVLLAYAWTMYLALFNGGRWMRQQLQDAGDQFWLGPDPPLSLWTFDGKEDGEDIHQAFKKSFNDAGAQLTDQEKLDVNAEAKRLFGICTEMVHFLDEEFGPPPPSSRTSQNQSPAPLFASDSVVAVLLAIWNYILGLFAQEEKPRAKDIHAE